MNLILRLFLTLSSVSFFLVVYLVQNEIELLPIPGKYAQVIHTVVYVSIPVLLSLVSLRICRLLAPSTIKKVVSIEVSNNDFLANYLAFFFVALSVKNGSTFWVVFGMTTLFIFVSRVSYFNPVFPVFGYNFYYVHTGENIKVMLITKKKLKNPNIFEGTNNLKRINDYTFIEIEHGKCNRKNKK